MSQIETAPTEPRVHTDAETIQRIQVLHGVRDQLADQRRRDAISRWHGLLRIVGSKR